MVINLSQALHEDKGTIGRRSVLSFLSDDPSSARCIVNSTVVSRHGFESEFDVSLHRPANGEAALLLVVGDQDLVLDHLLVLVGAHPCWPGSHHWVGVHSVRLVLSKHQELLGRRLGGLLHEGCLVEVVVNNLSKIHKGSLL